MSSSTSSPPLRLLKLFRTGLERRFRGSSSINLAPGPSMPWLEPDISDHLDELKATGARDVVIVPIGFISDPWKSCGIWIRSPCSTPARSV